MSYPYQDESDCTKCANADDGCLLFNTRANGKCLCVAFRKRTATVSTYTTIEEPNEDSGNKRLAWSKTE